jgi:dTDP-4-dehydrorhamnose 3,5-epimerase
MENYPKILPEGIKVIKPSVYTDERGFFFESYNVQRYDSQAVSCNFIQDNVSLSQKGTLRGLHFQFPPYQQAKLVYVLAGSALDVVVDIRRNSPTYGAHYALLLSAANFLQLFIPEGFAHGYLALEDNTLVCYKCNQYHHPEVEGGLSWNDPDLQIDWNISDPILSEKDKKFQPFRDFKSRF